MIAIENEELQSADTIVVGVFVAGFWAFNRIAPRVAEDL